MSKTFMMVESGVITLFRRICSTYVDVTYGITLKYRDVVYVTTIK